MESLNLNMLQSLKPFHCPNCNSTYSSKDLARFHTNKFPRILTCCHSVCENCLQKGSKEKGTFSCPLCKETVDVPGNEDIATKFLPDIHALGVLSANMKNSLPSIKVKMVPSGLMRQQSQESLKKQVCSIVCGKCSQNQASWQCDECQLNFCCQCFNEVHSGLKTTKKHVPRKIFAELYSSIVQEGCSEHENKPIEFYCEVDNQLTCSYCMLIGDHVGHEVKTLMDKNKSCAVELQEIFEDVTKMQKQLKYTDHLLSGVVPKEKVDVSDKIKEVHDYFHKLHAILQTREMGFISELTEASHQNIRPLEEMILTVTSYERDLAAIKKDAESVIDNPCLAISAPAILQKLEEIKNIPCHLVPIAENTESYLTIKVQLDTELEDKLKHAGQIITDFKPRFSLLKNDELPEEFSTVIPEEFEIKLQAALDAESCSTTTMDTFSEDSLSTRSSNGPSSSLHASLKSRDFIRMQPEKVIVSHMLNPTDFFVQRYAEMNKYKGMFSAIDRWCRTAEARKFIPHSVEKGDVYLVQYGLDKKWYRGRVKAVLEPEEPEGEETIGIKLPVRTEDGKIRVKNKEARVEVFYIDFGNTEIITLNLMRVMQGKFLNLPGAAKKCSLVDIQPASEKAWCTDAITAFAKFVENMTVIMQVYEDRNNVLYVDLCQVAVSNISNDGPVSVRDALVFLEVAVFAAGKQPAGKRKKYERKYMPPEALAVNVSINGIVSHVDDPSNVYVQQMSTASYLSSLIFDMNEAYNNDTNTLLHGVCAPHIGMMCAAQFSIDKQWYRAQVIGLPGGAKVQVRFVDFGNTEVANHKQLRKLFDRFTRLNIQAMPCTLAHLSHNQEICWSKEAKEWLTKQVSRKQMTIKSLGMIPGENKAEIVLYYTEDQYEICVNALMVDTGLATSTGKFSKTTRTAKPQSSAPSTKLVSDKFISLLEIPPPTAMANEFADLPFASPPRNEGATQKGTSPAQKSPEKAVAQETEKNRIEVHVSHVETPGLFFIQIANEQDKKKMDSLVKEMQDFYENVAGDVMDCSIGKAYAVYSKSQEKWFRGNIKGKVSEDKVKVYFVDFGGTEDIERVNIRKLTDQFSKEEAFAVRCHLDGIKPAGDSSQWSQSSCDILRQLVEPHEILLLCSKGEVDEEFKSLPADLHIERVVRGGALEPTKVEYISMSAEIVARGYALPIRRRTNPPAKKESEEPSSSHQTQSCGGVETISYIERPNAAFSSTVKLDFTVETEEELELLPPPEPKFRWKPAVPPMEPSFNGFVTNIGEDGSIQLYVMKQGSSQIDIITQALQFKCNKTPMQPLKTAPPVGEACIAKFSVDSQWYRAEVISVYADKIKVNFVDYGNNEMVHLQDIRLDIIMQDFPRQCLECVLHYENEQKFIFDNDLATFLHSQIVDTEVSVEVKAPKDENRRLVCSVTTLSGVNIADLLVSMGFSESHNDAVELTKAVEQNSLTKAFSPAREMAAGDTFPVCVTQVSACSVVCLQLLMVTTATSDTERAHNEHCEQFLQLIEDMRKVAESFPRIQQPLPGMPCCAKYSYDNLWYRCEVTDLTEDGVTVLYVDYGNFGTIPSDDLRELEDRFIEFPVQLRFCELDGIAPMGDAWDPEVTQILLQKLTGDGREIFARFVVPSNTAKVDLLTKEESGYVLAYHELIKDSLLRLEKTFDL